MATRECSQDVVQQPNGSRLSCGRPARRRKGVGRQSVPRQGHNTPVPLRRSPPASFKRLLGAAMRRRLHLLPETIELWVRKVVEHKMSVPSREESYALRLSTVL